MRRILLSCATLGVLTLPAAAASASASARAKPGFLVMRNAVNDGGVNGRPFVTIVMRHGFVLGRVGTNDEARVDIYELPPKRGQGAPTATATEPSRPVYWHGLHGREFNGSGFRFRAIGGYYRVVVRGTGVYVYAGGHGTVRIRGSSFAPGSDGKYSIDGGPFRSLPARVLKRAIGRG